MSNYHFGDDYDLNYYPPEASDGMGGVDWDKVERVEIECDVYVKERTCREVLVDKHWRGCSQCGYKWEFMYGIAECKRPNYCPNCGAKVNNTEQPFAE